MGPSIAAIYGSAYSASLGGISAWRVGLIAAIGCALMSIIVVIRHTRGDERRAASNCSARPPSAVRPHRPRR